MLADAIVDAKSLRAAALKNAENVVIEKYSNEVRKTLENIIEQVVDNIPRIFASDMPILTGTKVKGEHIKDVIEMFPSKHIEKITNHIIANKPNNYWDLLNAATWTATHLLNRKTEATHKLEDKIYPKVMSMAKVAQA